MTTKPIQNMSASVRAKLLELSRKNGEQFNFVLTRYALERLLYRLGSTNRERFVLKGAMLFALWTTRARHRPTVDMDLLGYGPPSLDNIRSIFQTVASLSADDGMIFLPETVETVEIREDAFYSGIRVTMEGRLGKASVPLQIDIGFGDDVTPSPAEAKYPTLLPMPAPVLRVYPWARKSRLQPTGMEPRDRMVARVTACAGQGACSFRTRRSRLQRSRSRRRRP